MSRSWRMNWNFEIDVRWCENYVFVNIQVFQCIVVETFLVYWRFPKRYETFGIRISNIMDDERKLKVDRGVERFFFFSHRPLQPHTAFSAKFISPNSSEAFASKILFTAAVFPPRKCEHSQNLIPKNHCKLCTIYYFLYIQRFKTKRKIKKEQTFIWMLFCLIKKQLIKQIYKNT